MSKYSHEEQENIVGMAAKLEAAIIFENEEIPRLEAESFKRQPAAPQLVSVPEPSVPEPQYIKHVPPKANAMRFPDYIRAKTKIPLAVYIALMAQALFFVYLWLINVTSSRTGTGLKVVLGLLALISLGVAGITLFTFITIKKKHQACIN